MDHPIPIEAIKHSILFQLDSVFPWENDLGHFLFVDELFRLHKALIEFYAHAVTIIHLRRNHIIFNERQTLLGFFIPTQFTVGSIKPMDKRIGFVFGCKIKTGPEIRETILNFIHKTKGCSPILVVKPILRIQLDAHCVICNSLPAFT